MVVDAREVTVTPNFRLVACFFALCTAQVYGEKLALVIGIAGYPGFPAGENLKFAGRDAAEFARFIQSAQGGSFSPDNVHLVTNGDANRVRVYDEFTWLYKIAGPDDLVYVFFAGHGVEFRNVLYLLPYDALKRSPDSLGIR
jgi:hypothetical protein